MALASHFENATYSLPVSMLKGYLVGLLNSFAICQEKKYFEIHALTIPSTPADLISSSTIDHHVTLLYPNINGQLFHDNPGLDLMLGKWICQNTLLIKRYEDYGKTFIHSHNSSGSGLSSAKIFL